MTDPKTWFTRSNIKRELGEYDRDGRHITYTDPDGGEHEFELSTPGYYGSWLSMLDHMRSRWVSFRSRDPLKRRERRFRRVLGKQQRRSFAESVKAYNRKLPRQACEFPIGQTEIPEFVERNLAARPGELHLGVLFEGAGLGDYFHVCDLVFKQEEQDDQVDAYLFEPLCGDWVPVEIKSRIGKNDRKMAWVRKRDITYPRGVLVETASTWDEKPDYALPEYIFVMSPVGGCVVIGAETEPDWNEYDFGRGPRLFCPMEHVMDFEDWISEYRSRLEEYDKPIPPLSDRWRAQA